MTREASLTVHDIPTPDNVPKEELDESKRTREEQEEGAATAVDMAEWIRLIVKLIAEENSEEELRRVRKVTKMMRYYRGEQRGFWSASTGEWITIQPDDFEPRDAAMLLINNQMRPMVKSLAKEWARSRSRMKVRARDDTVQKKGAARYATAYIEKYQDKLMPESFRQTEGKSAFLAGNYLRWTYYDKTRNKHSASIPKLEKVTREGLSYWWCPDCDREGDIEQLPGKGMAGRENCPECGAKAQVVKGKTKTFSKYAGVEKEIVGCPGTRLVDVREVKVHIRARSIEQTPYLMWTQYVMCAALKNLFRWAKIKPVTPSPVTRYIQETELSTGATGVMQTSLINVDNYGAGLGGMTEHRRLWLRPTLYFDLKAKQDLKLGSGKTIKQGEHFIDSYPDGMFVWVCGEEILDIDRDVMDDYWTHGAYDKLIESFWGDGTEDMLQMQELVNEMQSLMVENIIYNASPKIIYNPFLIEAAMMSNNPSEMVPMSRNAKRGDQPRDAVFQMAGMSITQDVPIAMEAGIETMRTQSGAHLAMQGSNDPRLTTATAMAIARDASVAQLGPPLALKAEVDVTWAYQILKMSQKYWVDGVSDKLLGNYTLQEAKWFKECNLEEDLEITVEPGSFIPRTELEVRSDFLNYITAGGIPLGFANPQIPYEIKSEAARLFRMPIDLDKLQPDIRNAALRIEQVQAATQVLINAGVIVEETESDEISAMIVADVPVDLYIDDHEVYMNTYSAWLKTDPGRFAPMVVYQAVQMLIQRHKEALEQLQDEQFSHQAKYAMTAQAMQGMLETEAANQQTTAESQAKVAEEQAKAATGAQQSAQGNQVAKRTEPIPLGEQVNRPTTSRAQASSALTPNPPQP